jgi:hypothetical protein
MQSLLHGYWFSANGGLNRNAMRCVITNICDLLNSWQQRPETGGLVSAAALTERSELRHGGRGKGAQKK